MTGTDAARDVPARRGRHVGPIVQLLGFGGVLWFLVHTAREHWGTVGRLDVAPSALPLLAASALTAATYVFLVGGWVVSLRWWQARLGFGTALRIWFLSNLARFVPGGIWQFASLAAMSLAEGLSPVAATGGVLLQQVVLLSTGLALTLAMAPQLLGEWTAGTPPGLLPAAAVAALTAFVVVFPAATPVLGRLVGRLARRQIAWPHPPRGEFAAYVLGLVLPWLAYGLAFWLFGRSLLGGEAPGLPLAVSAFCASYVAGIIAVFAPGGIVVREAALVAALSPTIGAERALLLAFGSRLWLVLVEVVTALVVVAISRRARPAPNS